MYPKPATGFFALKGVKEMNTTCWKCNHEMELIEKDITHTLFKVAVVVHKVPTYQCTHCDESFYIDADRVIEHLEEGYRSTLNEITYGDVK